MLYLYINLIKDPTKFKHFFISICSNPNDYFSRKFDHFFCLSTVRLTISNFVARAINNCYVLERHRCKLAKWNFTNALKRMTNSDYIHVICITCTIFKTYIYIIIYRWRNIFVCTCVACMHDRLQKAILKLKEWKLKDMNMQDKLLSCVTYYFVKTNSFVFHCLLQT